AWPDRCTFAWPHPAGLRTSSAPPYILGPASSDPVVCQSDPASSRRRRRTGHSATTRGQWRRESTSVWSCLSPNGLNTKVGAKLAPVALPLHTSGHFRIRRISERYGRTAQDSV